MSEDTEIGRDKIGRFATGNVGEPGRPRRATGRAYMAALSDAIALEDWREIVRRAVDDAKDGDAKARAAAEQAQAVLKTVGRKRKTSVTTRTTPG